MLTYNPKKIFRLWRSFSEMPPFQFWGDAEDGLNTFHESFRYIKNSKEFSEKDPYNVRH